MIRIKSHNMKNSISFSALLTILTAMVLGCKDLPSENSMEPVALVQEEQTRRTAIREVSLSGSGYELGYQHGQKLKQEIKAIVTKWKKNTESALKTDSEAVLDAFFKYARFEEAIRKYTPDL